MSFILTIETAVVGGSICLADGERVLGFNETAEPKETAAWLQPAIQDLMKEQHLSFKQLSAIAVSAGPGSYTGLRVGMASAKGLCYALKIPLITINTLQLMAAAALPGDTLLCPMIDARRMEVFTAIYDNALHEIQPTAPMILDEASFKETLERIPITFFGNGSAKFQNIIQHPNALFRNINVTAKSGVPLAYKAFKEKAFADLAYSEPQYGKAFFSPGFPPSV